VPEVEITVRGTAATTHAPEFAVVHLAATAQDSDRAQAQQRTSAAAQAITEAILPLVDEDDGPITHWWSEQLRVDTYREYQSNKDREVLVHRAAVQFRVRFRGMGDGSAAEMFAALNTWLGTIVAVDDVEVRNAEWALTDALRERLTEQVRSEAVRDAQQRAASYARDLGLTTVRPLAAADPGLLGSSAERDDWTHQVASRAVAFSKTAHGMDVSFRPEDIEVSAAVDMRFVAADGAD
jgi:uncharacterized protein YggE